MKANRTFEKPPQIEHLGDGTYYYNFNIVHSQLTEETTSVDSYDYDQVRCSLPVSSEEIQQEIDKQGINHKVIIND